MVELQMWKMKKVRLYNNIQTMGRVLVLSILLFDIFILYTLHPLTLYAWFSGNCKSWNESNLISVFVSWKMIMFNNLICTTKLKCTRRQFHSFSFFTGLFVLFIVYIRIGIKLHARHILLNSDKKYFDIFETVNIEIKLLKLTCFIYKTLPLYSKWKMERLFILYISW